MSGAEKEKREGRHIEMTFSLSLIDPKIVVHVKVCCHLDGCVNDFATLGLSIQPHIVMNAQEPDGSFTVDRLEFSSWYRMTLGIQDLNHWVH